MEYVTIKKMLGLLRKIIFCNTHQRFKRVFDRLETKGYELYLYPDQESPTYERKIKSFIKALGKTVKLYDKFVQ